MKEEIKVPSVGESITSGVIVGWRKQNGDSVKDGEILFDLETDKAVLEIPSPGSGVLEIKVAEGTEVEIGQTVAMLGEAEAKTEEEPSTKGEPEAAVPEEQEGKSEALSPAVRRIVAEHNLDTGAIEGTGKDGRITKEDALRAAEQQKEPEKSAGEAPPAKSAAPPPPQATETAKKPPAQSQPAVPAGRPPSVASAPAAVAGQDVGERRSERVPMSRIRRRTAERLVQATQSSAYLTTFNEIDMQKVIDIRTQYKAQFEKEHGIKIGFMSFFVKACCQALKEFACVNTEIDGADIIYKYFYDIGVAISIEEGLIVPNIRGADKLHFAEIETMIASLAQRAGEKKLVPDELTGGTFTITNGGIFGSLLSTPIPAYPQTAILGMHAIKKRPVAIDDQIVIRPMMYVALTYDHQVIDGRDAVGFLARIKEFIEQPDMLLLEL